MKDAEEKIIHAFSTHVKHALTRAMCLVMELELRSIEPQHVLWAIGTQKGSIAAEVLKKGDVSAAELRKFAVKTYAPKRPVKRTRKSSRTHTEPELHPQSRSILEKAILTANAHGHAHVGTEHVLSGLLQSPEHQIQQFFTKKSSRKTIEEQLHVVLKSMSKFPELTEHVGVLQSKESTMLTESLTPALDFFGRDMTRAAKEQALEPIIGREQEVRRLTEILCRRTKNNPLLLGDPGVGKTALVEGLAMRIIQGNVPEALQEKRIIALDLAHLIAGTVYRGEFEGRLRQIIDETKAHPDVILFIDEIHTMIGAGSASGSLDAANILKPALSRGEIHCIGATTFQEYKKGFEADQALERRFQTIDVSEPTEDEAIRMLHGISARFADFHEISIAPGVIEDIVRSSIRFLPHKRLPDKAIDLLDEAAAHLRVSTSGHHKNEAQRIRMQLREAEEAKRQAVAKERFLEAITHKETEDTLRQRLESMQNTPTHLPRPTLTARDIKKSITRMTGIPVHDLALGKTEIAQQLSEAVVGQPAAVEAISSALVRAKAALHDPKRPLASFLFLGPPGVGKTHTAKTIAQMLYGKDSSLIRLDMSEYAEGSSLSKLIGAPAGYVGYRESAKLTDQIKRKPHSVVIFDEIEKAHRDIQQLLLQILEEGELSDATGRTISFKHSTIVLTSNIGADKLRGTRLGFATINQSPQTGTEDIQEELRERLSPELIGRLDRICVFASLETKHLALLASRELSALKSRLLAEHGVKLIYPKALATQLTAHIPSPEGARGVKRCIEEHVIGPLADYVLCHAPTSWIRLHPKKDGTFSISHT